jgi:hypothetical protein
MSNPSMEIGDSMLNIVQYLINWGLLSQRPARVAVPKPTCYCPPWALTEFPFICFSLKGDPKNNLLGGLSLSCRELLFVANSVVLAAR